MKLKAWANKHRSFMGRLVDVCVGFVIGFFFALDVVFAKNIDMNKAGVTLWVFLAVGAMIILLQLIPAFIMFTTFISSGMYRVFKAAKKAERDAESNEVPVKVKKEA